MKKLSLIICVLVLFSLSSCDPPTYRYRGTNPELYTEVHNSILGMTSAESHEIYVLEKDSYGRTLFYAKGYSLFSNSYIAIIAISQAVDENSVSYCEFQNLTYKSISVDDWGMGVNNWDSFFNEEEVSLLKEKNHWNKSLDIDNLKNLSVQNQDFSYFDERFLEKISLEIFDTHKNVIWDPMTKLDDDRIIYYFSQYKNNDNSDDYIYYNHHIVIFTYDEDSSAYKFTYDAVSQPFDLCEYLNDASANN